MLIALMNLQCLAVTVNCGSANTKRAAQLHVGIVIILLPYKETDSDVFSVRTAILPFAVHCCSSFRCSLCVCQLMDAGSR